MKETRDWLWVQVVAGVAVMVLVAVSEVTAKPTAADATRHSIGNHVEDQFLDNALVDWLDNFGTYTFMVKQDLDSRAGHADEGDAEEEQEGGGVEVEDEEDVVEEWSAPIAVSTGQRSLLNPHHDYLVTVESLVAEEGSIFMTLSKYENQTICGVGGLSLEEEVQQVPRTGAGLDVAQEREPGGADHTTFIAFALQQEGNSSGSDSGWIAVSEQYWWASGYLTGGSILSITFTPPECGCLALSTYFALPLGNLTLVVGPQAYPEELQTLLCVDPLATAPDQEYEEEGHEDVEREEQEEEGGEEEEHIDYLQQPSALVASRNPGEEQVDETEATDAPTVQPTVLTQRKKMSREEKKMAKKTRKQMKRQRIRQAGRRQARQGQPNGGRKTTRRWSRKQNQRKRMKVWKKLNKRGKKGRRGKLGAKHHHGEVNGTSPEDMRQHDPHHHHHHHHHQAAHNANVSLIQQEERLVDILLRDLHAENTTLEGSEGGEEGNATMTTEGEEGEGEGEGEEAQTPRERRKNRRQRKKMIRKQRRKVYGPGVKFCCKQGVKHKKTLLELGNSSASSPGPCDTSNDVVITFANHQFGIEEGTCTTTFTTCCGRFTEEMWESIKARKEARKSERKQRRKSRRQDRKQRRKQERRLRKGMRRQGQARHHDEQ